MLLCVLTKFNKRIWWWWWLGSMFFFQCAQALIRFQWTPSISSHSGTYMYTVLLCSRFFCYFYCSAIFATLKQTGAIRRYWRVTSHRKMTHGVSLDLLLTSVRSKFHLARHVRHAVKRMQFSSWNLVVHRKSSTRRKTSSTQLDLFRGL